MKTYYQLFLFLAIMVGLGSSTPVQSSNAAVVDESISLKPTTFDNDTDYVVVPVKRNAVARISPKSELSLMPVRASHDVKRSEEDTDDEDDTEIIAYNPAYVYVVVYTYVVVYIYNVL